MKYRVIIHKNTSKSHIEQVENLVSATNLDFEECNMLITAIDIVGKFPVYHGDFTECKTVFDKLANLLYEAELSVCQS